MKYRRGFIITDKVIEVPSHFNTLKINDFYFSYDSCSEMSSKICEKKFVVVLGKVVDLILESNNVNVICEKLLSTYIKSEDEFIKSMDDLAGRFIIIWGDEDNLKICNDATGMRSIFYHKVENIISSHCALIQEITKDSYIKTIKKFKEFSSHCMPANYSPVENVLVLTPNTFLDSKNKTVVRFWPRENLENNTLDNVVESVIKYTDIQLKLLENKYKIINSLSGGMDSRTTLALLKEHVDDITFFTYSRKKNSITRKDNIIVKKIVDDLNLKHESFEIDENTSTYEFEELKKILVKNTVSNHSFTLASQYLKRYSSDDLIHIRSNLYEIGQCYYRSYMNLPKELTIRDAIKCYSSKAINDDEVIEIYEQYLKTVDMNKIFNYDPYDILYWEQRMGTWLSQVISETDIAHDTYILFNNRRILSDILSVSNKDKLKLNVFKEIINKKWSVLNYWGINEISTLKHKIDKEFDEYGEIFEEVNFYSGNLNDDKKDIAINYFEDERRLKFNMIKGDPQEGDFAEAVIKIKNDRKNKCYIYIRSPYRNNIVRDKIFYQVFINGIIMAEEDICCWDNSNIISISEIESIDNLEVKIRIISKDNCGNYSWGRHSRILIERIVLSDEKTTTKERVSATSPYTIIF
ncbi:7-cyano-7-deazaguanine synthase [Clostridium tertium]|uniref:asparagine synthase (glutamine-hydrolyzing) n=1 Tax=Clostridium tertium TaxID=1559 RepID=A0A9X3XJ27_9CLOT|nr:7-cyano-7-deazaguanine synthase [Clostridium tertium]